MKATLPQGPRLLRQIRPTNILSFGPDTEALPALPPLVDLEKRARHDVQDSLTRATRDCSNAYAKGKRSFEVLAKLSPATLEKHLPSFVRVRRILNSQLKFPP